LSPEQREELIRAMKARFEKNVLKYKQSWKVVLKNCGHSVKWKELAVNRTLLVRIKRRGEYIFYDCSAESPKGRRSVRYDREALDSRKEQKPEDSAMDMAAAMGIELLTEEQYRELQKLGNFDTKRRAG
jgi:hypothetical protein